MQDLRGRTIKGYQLLELMNLGGFGAVYRAYQEMVEREVAFKIILPQYASQPEFIRRFEAEAQLVARLEHLHIVPLYDYWRDPDGAYLVMRWLRGGSLRAALARRGYFDVMTAASLLDQMAAGLAVAHRQGVVHRDIKPDNILLDEDGNAYIADFGIAIKLIDLSQLDQKEMRLGSPPYTPPEQILGQTITPQTDIYSLGIVLFELLTGRVPFSGPNDTEVMRLHLTEPVPPIQQWRPELPESLNRVIWRATAKAFRGRYATALEMAQDFRQSLELVDKRVLVQPLEVEFSPSITTGELHTVNLAERPAPVNPYKGLRPFQEADAADFFGREKQVERLVEIFQRGGEDNRFLAVVGPSGSGKSSVVNAGFIPVLREGVVPGSDNWFYGSMVPGAQPFKQLQDALLRYAAQSVPDLELLLRGSDDGLHRSLMQLLPKAGSDLLLVIDQFEEVFTLAGEVERGQFLRALEAAVRHPESRLRLIVTLRADFYDRPLLYPGFGELIRAHTEVILPLTPGELAQAIRAPAERVGLYVEQDLVAAVVADVNKEPGALPLLQYTLTELFEHRTSNDDLTLAAYQAVGGISGALARRADEIYGGLPPARRELAQQMFVRLVKIGENQEVTRRRALQAEILALGTDRAAMIAVMDAFARYRLLTFDHEPASRAPTVELAHEALIHEWKQLAAWIEAGRDDLRMEQRLAAATGEWLRARRDASFLASGARLAQFEALTQSKLLTLNADEHAYVQASTAARRRAVRRARLVMAALALFSLVALVLAGLALTERDRADLQARLSGSRALAVTALTHQDQLDLSLLLSLQALETADTFEARNSLLTGLQLRPHLSRFLHGHTASARSVAFSPDGKQAASGSWDHTVIVWDVITGQPAFPPLTGPADDVNAVVFSPDGRRLAAGSKDGSIYLWDATNGRMMGQPLSSGAAVWSLAFSPAGDTLAAGRADGVIDFWHPAADGQRDSIPAHEDAIVYSVAFDPTGTYLASGGADNRVRLWDVATGEPVADMPPEHTNWVMSVAFSPDGSLVASAGADRQIVLWDAVSGQPVGQIATDHTDWVTSIAFDLTGTLLVSGSGDGVIKLWDMLTGQPVAALAGNTDKVWSVAFSPDGNQLLSGANDGVVLLWDVSPTYRTLGRALEGYSEIISSVAISPDGMLIVSADGDPAGHDNAVRLWDRSSGQLIGVLEGHLGPVLDVTFSPDGQMIASASADQTVRLWSAADHSPLGEPLVGHSNAVFGVAFSPDGAVLASASDDGSIILWDIQTGTSLGAPLRGHTTGVLTLAFSPDGRLLASGGRDNAVRLWDVAAHQLAGEPLAGHTDYVERVTFSPDGRWLASASRDRTIILWDVATRQPAAPPLTGHVQPVLDAAFSPDGRWLVSGGRDNQVLLWDVEAGRVLGTGFSGHTDWVNGVAFSPDGRSIVSGSADRTLIIWDASLASWQDRACYITNRALSEAEITNYLGNTPYQAGCGVSAAP